MVAISRPPLPILPRDKKISAPGRALNPDSFSAILRLNLDHLTGLVQLRAPFRQELEHTLTETSVDLGWAALALTDPIEPREKLPAPIR